MKLLYDYQIFQAQQYGGISRIYAEVMRELSFEEQCQIYWFRGLRGPLDVGEFSSRLKAYSDFRKPFYWNLVDPVRRHRAGFASFARRFGPFDIYHPTYYDSAALELAPYKKTAVFVYDMIPELFLSGLERFRPLLEGKKAVLSKADALFAISESAADDLERIYKIPRARVRVVPLASRLSKKVEDASSDNVCGKPFFLYVGTRSKYKNFDCLVRAFENPFLKENFRVVCFGGTAGFNPEELRRMEETKTRGCFSYAQGPDTVLKSLYRSAVALAFTSRYEGFGLPVLEAMDCGCPVVCCRVAALPEVAGDAALYVTPDSAEELSAALVKVASSPSCREGLIARGIERARLFSWRKTANILLDGYRDLL